MKNQYLSYDEGTKLLKNLSDKFPDILQVKSIGKTHENRDIVLATLSFDIENESTKPALLFTGTIHAREWIGHELCLKFITYILNNFDTNPQIKEYLKRSTLYMVPCLNPDGFEYSRKHFSFWRKNRKKNKDGSYGVDLNRNFSIGFVKTSQMSSNVYGGEEAFSEPETKAIKEFVDTHNNITIALDYHSQGNVFFPAHKFRHEQEIDGTDLNTICANMSEKIHKVTGRNYGIHRGKPPAKLISGSGREYYYSKGIKAIVVEVGTKNIPDYMKVMSSSINENIPALLEAFKETINYSSLAPKRVDNFTIQCVEETFLKLRWDYELRNDIYFEIYRNTKDKASCEIQNIVGITKEHTFKDIELESATTYYYTIRAVNKQTNLRSPFAPVVKVKTGLEKDEFSKMLFALKNETGYVGENMNETNRSHFGNNSLFVGINKTKGICNALICYDTSSIPKNAIIKKARLHLYPMNRVAAKIERFGEWNLSLLDNDDINDVADFAQVENAPCIQVIGDAIKSQSLTQGIWNYWEFSSYQCSLLQKELIKNKAVFRVDGPKTLPYGEDSQMMQFDIGYGNYGGGLHYRPMLEIKYTIPSQKIEIEPNIAESISQNLKKSQFESGYNKDGNKIYGHLEYDLSTLPSSCTTVITRAYIELSNQTVYTKSKGISFYLELLDNDIILSYEDIKNRERVEYIGYEIRDVDLKKREKHYFIFDTLSKLSLENIHANSKRLEIIIKPTSTQSNVKNRIVKWGIKPKLIIEYINRRKTPVSKVTNLANKIDKGRIKLSWKNPKDEDFIGVYVVRNSFHPPKNFMDGVKIYGGKDDYTYDTFGSLDKEKYYSIFTYDNVPNYSEPEILHFVP